MSELDLGTLRGKVDLDVQSFDRKYGQVDASLTRMAARKIPDVVLDADGSRAEKAITAVEDAGESLARREFDPAIDADIAKAERKVADITRELDVLQRMDASPQVDADVAKAQSALSGAEARLRALNGLRAEMLVQADTSGAEQALGDVVDDATDAGGRAGAGAGANLAGGILAALATIPVAGAIVGIGKAIGDALMSGLENEVRADRLAAMTDLSPEQVASVGRAAGEAYASNFGESIAANMDTARLAIQAGLLDPNATVRDTQAVIEQLSGVADLLGEDIPRVARSAAQAVKTGIAGDASQAFDLLVRAQKSGLNVSEDLLDTVDEYGTQFRKLGLEGPQAFGLIAQAVRAGARDTDIGADALKEFAIRAVDGSKLTADSFAAIGLSASDMSAKIAAGGPDAAAALDLTLDKLRAVEDPATRAQIAVGLFGTQAEDLGDALYAMDLSSAVEQLGQVEGAASSALSTLGDNSAGKIAEAKRNIEVAADGIQGALASAFAPQIEGFATFVTENRAAVIEFLLDATNGAIDFGRVLVEAIAGGIEAGGAFVAGPLADMIEGFGEALKAASWLLGSGDAGESLTNMADSMRDVDDAASDVADTIRTNLVENTLDPAQAKLNEFGDGFLSDARLHDATTRLAGAIDGVGYAADGTALLLDGLVLSSDGGVTAVGALDEQLRATRSALDEQARAALEAGEGQDSLTQRYQAGRDALIYQLTQMGLNQTQAEQLADAYGLVPGNVNTMFAAETSTAQNAIDGFITNNSGRRIKVYVDAAGGNPVYSTDPTNRTVMRFEASGDIVEFMANGGLRGAIPMSNSLAVMVPPGTKRIVGDRNDVPELYAPLDGSARTDALLGEAAARSGGAYLPRGYADMLAPTPAPAAATPTPIAASPSVTTAAPHVTVRAVLQIGEDQLDAYLDQRSTKVVATNIAEMGV